MSAQLGFMAPNGQTNLAVKDTVTALQFLQTIAPSFGGDASAITVDGQSSGANMIRALLAAPSVSDLFQYAILQSDPMVCPYVQYRALRITDSPCRTTVS